MINMYDNRMDFTSTVSTVQDEIFIRDAGENLTVMLRETKALVHDSLAMVQRLNSHITGSNIPDEKEFDAKCFRDDLGWINKQLKMLYEELATVSSVIGS